MRRLGPALALAAVVAALAVVVSGGGAASAERDATAEGTGGAVASMDFDASAAGIDVLKHGGDAIDAAVASASTIGVTLPFVGGPGGAGVMLIYLARTHRVATISGLEDCPSACTATMFTDPSTGRPLSQDDVSGQPLSTGVPSMVATWDSAVRLYGRRSLAEDLQPAIRVAERGFRVSAGFRQLERSRLTVLQRYRATRALLLTKGGHSLPVGYHLRNPDLARTYTQLARHGPSYFYDGPIGRAIVNAADHPDVYPGSKGVTLPGIMTMSDLRSYAVRDQAPTRVRYRGLSVYGIAPPSGGGSTEGEILNILSGYDLGGEPRATELFHFIEASRLAYADRNAYVGDPRHVQVPLAGLLSPEFAASRRCLIQGTALTSPVAPGHPFPPFATCSGASAATAPPEVGHTNNIVTADRWGNVVVYTNTISNFGGSGQTVPGYGFLLNDGLTKFDFTGSTTDPNLPAPGKQPRTTMGPIIALRAGRPAFAIGAAGGATIITTVVQTLINHVDFGMSMPAALAAPRVSQSDSPTSLAEPDFYNSPLARQLRDQFGERFTLATGRVLPLDNYPGDATALEILAGGRVRAIAEPVRYGGGSALVVHPSQ